MVTKLVLLLLMFPGFAYAGDYTDTQIVEAIYKAEGGNKATWLYGIRSVSYDTPQEARRICFNSVRNNRKRWIKAGKPESFIVFMGRRYCPPKAHAKNSNWVRNVTYFLNRG